MQKIDIKLKNIQKLSSKIKLINAIRFAKLVDLPEEKFNKKILEIETNPLFWRLFIPDTNRDEMKLIYKRRIKPFFNNINIPGTRDEELEKTISMENISENFRNDKIYFRRICSVRKEGINLVICDMPDDHRYSYCYDIDEVAYNKIMKSAVFSEEDKKKIKELVLTLKEINQRKISMLKILSAIIDYQYDYFISSDNKKIKVLTLDTIVLKIKEKFSDTIHKSTVSRFVSNKSIKLPDGRDTKLKDLFLHESKIKKTALISFIMKEREDFLKGKICKTYTDSEIQKNIMQELEMNISRRAVTFIRNKASIPGMSGRAKIYSKRKQIIKRAYI